MPTNRIAGLGAVLSAFVGALVTLLGAIDNDTAKAVVVGVAILSAAAVAITFMLGSQRWDSLIMSDGAPSIGPYQVQVNVGDDGDHHEDLPKDKPEFEDSGEVGEIHEDEDEDEDDLADPAIDSPYGNVVASHDMKGTGDLS